MSTSRRRTLLWLSPSFSLSFIDAGILLVSAGVLQTIIQESVLRVWASSILKVGCSRSRSRRKVVEDFVVKNQFTFMFTSWVQIGHNHFTKFFDRCSELFVNFISSVWAVYNRYLFVLEWQTRLLDGLRMRQKIRRLISRKASLTAMAMGCSDPR